MSKIALILILSFLVTQAKPKSLYQISLEYEPKSISLNTADFESLDLSVGSTSNELGSFIILLKQYDYHLACCHQSYDLLEVMSKQIVILDIALCKMGKSKQDFREGLGSWIPYDFLKKNIYLFEDNEVIQGLMAEIQVRKNKINQGSHWKGE